VSQQVGGSKVAAERYGKVRATLDRAGTPIGPLDTLIASHALSLDVPLVTNNEREFRRVVGLRVENWQAMWRLVAMGLVLGRR